MLKKELLALAKLNRKPTHYILEGLLAGTEHEILRLPPYHACFNPIELVWGLVKRYFDAHVGRNQDYSEKMMKTIFKEALDQVTPAVWKNVCDKVEAKIIAAYEAELGSDEGHDEGFRMVISLSGDDSDDDDDDDWETVGRSEHFGIAQEQAVDDPEPIEGECMCAMVTVMYETYTAFLFADMFFFKPKRACTT